MNHVIQTARRIAVAAAIAITSASAFAAPIVNGTFDTPAVSAGNFTYLTGTYNSWTYAGESGIATNGSGFNVIGGAGGVGILQQAGSSISQVFNFTDNILSLTFSAEGRNGYGANSISVLIDGVALVFNGATAFLPSSTTAFTTYTSNVIALAAGNHTLSFVGNGVGGRDVTSFIDNVSLTTAVPEPVTLGLFGLGLVALGAARRKAKQA